MVFTITAGAWRYHISAADGTRVDQSKDARRARDSVAALSTRVRPPLPACINVKVSRIVRTAWRLRSGCWRWRRRRRRRWHWRRWRRWWACNIDTSVGAALNKECNGGRSIDWRIARTARIPTPRCARPACVAVGGIVDTCESRRKDRRQEQRHHCARTRTAGTINLQRAQLTFNGQFKGHN